MGWLFSTITKQAFFFFLFSCIECHSCSCKVIATHPSHQVFVWSHQSNNQLYHYHREGSFPSKPMFYVCFYALTSVTRTIQQARLCYFHWEPIITFQKQHFNMFNILDNTFAWSQEWQLTLRNVDIVSLV